MWLRKALGGAAGGLRLTLRPNEVVPPAMDPAQILPHTSPHMCSHLSSRSDWSFPSLRPGEAAPPAVDPAAQEASIALARRQGAALIQNTHNLVSGSAGQQGAALSHNTHNLASALREKRAAVAVSHQQRHGMMAEAHQRRQQRGAEGEARGGSRIGLGGRRRLLSMEGSGEHDGDGGRGGSGSTAKAAGGSGMSGMSGISGEDNAQLWLDPIGADPQNYQSASNEDGSGAATGGTGGEPPSQRMLLNASALSGHHGSSRSGSTSGSASGKPGVEQSKPPFARQLRPLPLRPKRLFEELILAVTPDSWSWQHMHARVANVMLQVRLGGEGERAGGGNARLVQMRLEVVLAAHYQHYGGRGGLRRGGACGGGGACRNGSMQGDWGERWGRGRGGVYYHGPMLYYYPVAASAFVSFNLSGAVPPATSICTGPSLTHLHALSGSKVLSNWAVGSRRILRPHPHICAQGRHLHAPSGSKVLTGRRPEASIIWEMWEMLMQVGRRGGGWRAGN